MAAQLAYTQRASEGLHASLKSLVVLSFASVIAGVGLLTAAIVVATQASAEWQKNMLNISQLANLNLDTAAGRNQYNQMSAGLLNTYANNPISEVNLFKAADPFAAAGYSGKELIALTESTAKYSATSKVATDDISTMIIQLAAINPKAVEAAGGMENFAKRTFSALTASANAGVITAQQLVTGLTQSSGSLAKWGMQNSIERQTAMLQTMAQFGLDANSWKTTLSSQVSGPGLTGPSTMSGDLSRALAAQGINLPSETSTVTGYYKTGDKKGQPKISTEKNKYTGADIAAQLMGMDTPGFMAEFDKNAEGLMINLYDRIQGLNMPQLQKNQLYGLVLGERAAREAPKMAGVDAGKYLQEALKGKEGVIGINQAYGEGTLAAKAYETTLAGLEAQWDVMTNRAHAIKTLLGDMFAGPITASVKNFSNSLMGAVTWLQGVIANSRFPDGTLNSWRAIQQVIDALKEKLGGLSGAFQAAGVVAGLSAMSSGLSGIVAVATGAATGIGAVTGAAATLVLGLGLIGYSLNPEKFTYFNTIAGDAIRGISKVATDVATDLAAGDWSAAATHIKDAFDASVTYIKGINWKELGGEIATMIGDGASAVINGVVYIGSYISKSLADWVASGAAKTAGSDIATSLVAGAGAWLSTYSLWDIIKGIFGLSYNWFVFGQELIQGFVGGLLTADYSDVLYPLKLKIYEIHDDFVIFAATLAAGFVGVGIDIVNALSPIKPIIDSAIEAVQGLVNWVATAISDLKNMLSLKSMTSTQSSDSSDYPSSGSTPGLPGSPGNNWAGGGNMGSYTGDPNWANNNVAAGPQQLGQNLYPVSIDENTGQLEILNDYLQQSTEPSLYATAWTVDTANTGDRRDPVVLDQSSIPDLIPLTNSMDGSRNYLGQIMDVFDSPLKEAGLNTIKNQPYVVGQYQCAQFTLAEMKKIVELVPGIEDKLVQISLGSNGDAPHSIWGLSDIYPSEYGMNQYDPRNIATFGLYGDDPDYTGQLSNYEYGSTATVTPYEHFIIDPYKNTQAYSTGEQFQYTKLNQGTDSSKINWDGLWDGTVKADGILSSSITTLISATDKQMAQQKAYDGVFNALGGLWAPALKNQKYVEDNLKLMSVTADDILSGSEASLKNSADALFNRLPGAGDALKNAGVETGKSLTDTIPLFQGLGDTFKSVSQEAKEVTVSASREASTALRLGAEVSARFFTDAGNAVSIGLNSAGQQVAVIGQVAQRQFEDAGGKWVVKTDAAALSHANIVGLSATDFKARMTESGDYTWMSGKSASDAIVSGTNLGMGTFTTGVDGSTGTFSSGVGGATNTFSSGVVNATNGLVSGLGTATGSLVGAIMGAGNSLVSMFGKYTMTMNNPFAILSTGGSQSVGSIGSATQTFNDCMFEGFTDTCTNMNINALKYTSPGGDVTYFNPMDNSGVRNLSGGIPGGYSGGSSYSGGYSTGGGGYTGGVVAIGGATGYHGTYFAKGALVEKPTEAIIGEAGREMVLPNNITEMFLRLLAMGFKGESSTNDGPITIVLQIDGEEITRVVTSRMKSKLNIRGLKTH